MFVSWRHKPNPMTHPAPDHGLLFVLQFQYYCMANPRRAVGFERACLRTRRLARFFKQCQTDLLR
jgi:hypothetical protein